MGDVIKYRRPPRNQGQFHGQGGWKPSPDGPKRPKRKFGPFLKTVLPIAGLLALAILWWGIDQAVAGESFACKVTSVIDGDTFDCDGQRIRMQGIDAPEQPGHCRKGRDCTPGDPVASTNNLKALIAAGPVTCRKTDTDAYGRTVAHCMAAGADLSCKQIEGGHAVRRYAPIFC